MKKNALLLICLLCSCTLMAQQVKIPVINRFYVNIGLGGGISTSSSFSILYDLDVNSANPSISVHPVGLGNGFNGYATFGFRFNKYIAVEVTANEFLGLPVGGDSVVNFYGSGNAEAKVVGRMFSLVPAIVICAGLDKINPYARLGLVVGAIPSMITMYTETNEKGNPATSLQIYNHYYGGVALGYSAAGGVSFTISTRIHLFTELQFSHSTWSPDHSEITKYTEYEVDKLSTLTTYEKWVDFVGKKYLADPKNSGAPRQELRMTIPFSTFAANFGLSFNF